MSLAHHLTHRAVQLDEWAEQLLLYADPAALRAADALRTAADQLAGSALVLIDAPVDAR